MAHDSWTILSLSANALFDFNHCMFVFPLYFLLPFVWLSSTTFMSLFSILLFFFSDLFLMLYLFFYSCAAICTAHFPAACKNEAKWMFGHLDINSDGSLSASEMYDLEHDQNERCIKPFIDTCDMDKDSILSPREWCRCFEKTDRPCAAVRRRIGNDLLGKNLMNSFIFFFDNFPLALASNKFSIICR